MDNKVLIISVTTAIITLIFNGLFHVLKNKLDWFVDKKKFKRDRNYNQLKELYLQLYGVVSQSEYLRFFMRTYYNQSVPFSEVPFIQIQRTKVTINENGVTKEEIKDGIAEFNKLNIVTNIIEKSEFASQRLLKLAVAYRYIHKHYEDETIPKKLLDNFQEEELKLINLIVKTIVKESSEYLEECHLDFNGKEASYGIMDFEFLKVCVNEKDNDN